MSEQPLSEALPLVPSTSDDNVARARLRRDIETRERQLAAAELVGRQLAAMSRQPFRDLLREMIGAAPTPEAIRRFADKYPDRWAQATSILAGLAGYERGIVEVNVFHIKGLSDADLMRRLDEVEAALAAASPRAKPATGGRVLDVVDAEVVEKQGPAGAGESIAASGGGPLPPRDMSDPAGHDMEGT